MTPYTYGQMFTDLQSWNEDYSSDLQQELPRIIQNGELRALRDLDLDAMDYQVPTSAIDQTTGIVSKPPNMIRDRVLVSLDDTPAVVSVLVKRTYDFIIEYNAANGVAVGPPKYYGEYTLNQWGIAPIPDQAYTISVRGIFPTPLLGDNDSLNDSDYWAVAQNTTAATPLTLLTPGAPPYATPIALTSTGDMASNSFTIVGTDVDGDVLTEVLGGPNAGYTETFESFATVTSVTPTLTDNVNMVSVGFYSDNTSWLSTRFPDLLAAACMIEVTGYLKRFSAQAVAKNDYNEKLQDALQQTRNMQRSDPDDLFATRQLVNGPPAQQVVPPTAQVAQAPVPGSQ